MGGWNLLPVGVEGIYLRQIGKRRGFAHIDKVTVYSDASSSGTCELLFYLNLLYLYDKKVFHRWQYYRIHRLSMHIQELDLFLSFGQISQIQSLLDTDSHRRRTDLHRFYIVIHKFRETSTSYRK